MRKKNQSPNIFYTVKHNLCTGCGICVGACPVQAIKMQVHRGTFIPQIDVHKCNNEKGCHRCMDSCPGVGIEISKKSQEEFKSPHNLFNKYIGYFINCYTGYSSDYEIRYHSASGGMITQLLIWLLDKKYINGAFVTKFNPNSPLLVESFLATTKEDILNAKSSKYAPVTLEQSIKEIKNKEGKFVIVGLPCHIHGFRKYESIDTKFKEKIFAYFGIYCSGSRTFYLTEHVLKERKIDIESLTYLSYRDEGCLGGLVAKGINKQTHQPYHYYEDYQKYCHPLRSFFVPRRCLLCTDHFAELADISFGDIHVKPFLNDKIGINSFIIRKEKYLKYIYEAGNDGVITFATTSPDILLSSQIAVKQKKHRAATFIKIDKFLGRKIPIYDIQFDDPNIIKSLISYLHNMLQIFIGNHKILWPIIQILKKKTKVE